MKINFEMMMAIITTLEESSRIRGSSVFTYTPETMLSIAGFLRNIMREKEVRIDEENETV